MTVLEHFLIGFCIGFTISVFLGFFIRGLLA